jgi:hypothetical protein
MLLHVFQLALPATLALRALAGAGAVEALAAVAGPFANGTLAAAAADIALHSVFIHTGRIAR